MPSISCTVPTIPARPCQLACHAAITIRPWWRSDATARASSRSARPGKALSSDRSARRWTRARSMSCPTRGSGCRSRTTRPRGSERSGSGCCAMPAWRRRGSRRTRRSARSCARRDVLLARAAAAGTSPLARARLRRAFERVVAEANRAIERLNAEAPTDRQHRRPLDPEAELARLEAAFRRLTAAARAPHARNGKRTPLRWPFVSWGARIRPISVDSGWFGPPDRPSMAVTCHPMHAMRPAGPACARPGSPSSGSRRRLRPRTTRSAVGEVLPVLVAAHDQDQRGQQAEHGLGDREPDLLVHR